MERFTGLAGQISIARGGNLSYFTNQLVNSLARMPLYRAFAWFNPLHLTFNRSLGCNLRQCLERAGYRFRNQQRTMRDHITAIIILRNPKLASGAVSWMS